MPPDDHKWFEEHLKPHESLVRTWLIARNLKREDIDEIVQEAFYKVLKARKTTNIKSPKAFLLTTARNITYGRFRRKLVRNQVPLAEVGESDILSNDESIQEKAEHSEEIELLTRAIQSLPKRCRQVITLRKIYGMSNIQIAKELGISIHTVESQGTIGVHKINMYLADYKE